MAMDMRGSLNVSKFQKTSNQPRFYGRCLINGVTYVIKGWEKSGQDGPWISLLFESQGSSDDFEQCAPQKVQIFSGTPVMSEKKPVRNPPNLGEGYSDYLRDDDVPF